MERTEIVEKVRNVIIAVLKHDRFETREDLSARDVEGWDSMSHMAIITQIEKEFQIKFKLKEVNKLSNFGTLVDLVQSKL